MNELIYVLRWDQNATLHYCDSDGALCKTIVPVFKDPVKMEDVPISATVHQTCAHLAEKRRIEAGV